MGLGRTLLRFLFLAAIGHQITYTVVEGGIFEDLRERISATHPKLEEFVHCHLCVGSWAGLVLAGIYQPKLLADVDARPPSALRKVANLAGDAVLIALGTRLWNESLGWLRREVQVKQNEIEMDRAMQPGISIRS